jgi:NADH-quinone oxidoreductase subunit D
MVYLISNNTENLYHFEIKTLVFLYLQVSKKVFLKHMVADVVTLIGTQDIVFGEIDR